MMPRLTICSSLLLLVVTLQGATTAFRPSRQWGLVTKAEVNLSTCSSSRSSDVIQRLRAGATDDDEEEEDEEDEEEDEDEVEVEEEEEEEEDEEEEEEEETDDDEEEETSELIEATEDDAAVEEYDAMLIPSPSLQMYSVIGVMLLARKLDMFSPTVVKAGRYVSTISTPAHYCLVQNA